MSDVHAYIFFGVILANEDFHPLDAPWDKDGFSCEKDWWRHIKGYKPSFEIFDERGEWLGGVKPSEEVIDRFCAERRQWFEQNPLPFDTIKLGSDKFDCTALEVPNSGHIASQFEPWDFDPTKLVVTPDAVSALKQFCKEHGIDQEPRWHLGCRA